MSSLTTIKSTVLIETATPFVVSFVLVLNRVNVGRRSGDHNTCLACRCDCTSCSFMFPRHAIRACLRARGVQGALPPGRGSLGVWGVAELRKYKIQKVFVMPQHDNIVFYHAQV